MFPPRDRLFLPLLLEERARTVPNATCVTFEDRATWTWRDAAQACRKSSAALHAAGIQPGDRVVIMMENGPAWLRAWWGLSGLGATMVPLNPVLRGELLQHCRTVTEPTAALAVGAQAELLRELGLRVIDPEWLRTCDVAEAPSVHLDPWDVHTINFTSGTTGLSKAVVTTHLHSFCAAAAPTWDPGPVDTLLAHSPLFHSSGQVNAMQAWLGGAAIALRKKFTRTRFLDVVRTTGSTMVQFVGTMAAAIEDSPEQPDDADNPIRIVKVGGPMLKDPARFAERFGIAAFAGAYGMTEVGTLFSWCRPAVEKPGTVGRPRPGVQVRLVDEHDVPVPPGQRGELVVRTERPWELMTEYLNEPAATANAWRNGWFHTGDLLWCDPDGDYFFSERLTDSLRRRGENISSQEVEREVRKHPAVAQVACVGVPGDFGEDEVKVFVVPEPGRDCDPADIIRFVEALLPPYMVPRFVEVIAELPQTPSHRVRKSELRARPNSGQTWDRERHLVGGAQ
jgi:crotonobetaine/carnitine-CoA ligase